ncbi:endonuclease [Hymenobacter qilianensis]|uniref:Endonuclease n=2 Tax=Hymenobacter qilianensis TaxID=1385715 RepID=A0ACB5PWU7_9BACT|nr:endonuclease/exonuclease/phosphatase family protein [Hymenobacter qilianensis]QNP54300.1 endonuclease/exonuclease/phosphatase family protein [Hymenobacter qilianensis]GGF80103.1 endonuclease [Hymenobacter qilianensis]
MTSLAACLRYLLAGVGTLALLLTLLSLGPAPVWWLEVLKFPRLQLLLTHALVLSGLLLLGLPPPRRAGLLLLLGTGVGFALQASFLLPYTALGPKTVPDARPAAAASPANRVRLLIVNVLMDNRHAAPLRHLVHQLQPDVLLALETDAWWVQALRPLHGQYPYRVELPRANTYGLVLYSRLPLQHTRVAYLEHPAVPSLHTRLRLPDGRWINFHGVHPPPPVPLEHLATRDDYQDATLLQVGQLVQQRPGPAIVAGDFNDVSWSHTTRLFEADGRLRNVRLGRGLYSSFRATSWILRWPLDHIFVTQQFRLVTLRRLRDIHSDHFPIYAELLLPAADAP